MIAPEKEKETESFPFKAWRGCSFRVGVGGREKESKNLSSSPQPHPGVSAPFPRTRERSDFS